MYRTRIIDPLFIASCHSGAYVILLSIDTGRLLGITVFPFSNICRPPYLKRLTVFDVQLGSGNNFFEYFQKL